MKRLLKSLLVITTVASAVVASTGAYFTSAVTAPDNQINTGTLALGIDSTRMHERTSIAPAGTWGGGSNPLLDGYTVVQDENGVSVPYLPLETWVNAAPGTYTPYVNDVGADDLDEGNFSYWVSLRNNGSVEMKVRANAVGDWTNLPRLGTLACSSVGINTLADANEALVNVRHVTFYRESGAPSGICNSEEECENIYYGLTNLGAGWTYATDPQAFGADVEISGAPIVGNVYMTADGTDNTDPTNVISLKEKEFMLARIDANLDSSAGNCYQGATYEFDLNGFASQVNDLAW